MLWLAISWLVFLSLFTDRALIPCADCRIPYVFDNAVPLNDDITIFQVRWNHDITISQLRCDDDITVCTSLNSGTHTYTYTHNHDIPWYSSMCSDGAIMNRAKQLGALTKMQFLCIIIWWALWCHMSVPISLFEAVRVLVDMCMCVHMYMVCTSTCVYLHVCALQMYSTCTSKCARLYMYTLYMHAGLSWSVLSFPIVMIFRFLLSFRFVPLPPYLHFSPSLSLPVLSSLRKSSY